ncbi:MAG: DUF177 domain-containing protein [Alphaproteobacteria bacterium]|nr:DUF177 domain-containing protein [Alphaproteobacteria bacterium]
MSGAGASGGERSPEFSRPVALDSLHPGETRFEIAASAAERLALATRFAILTIEQLDARVRVIRLPRANRFRLLGDLAADVVQSCVVTLEPVPQRVAATFDLTFERVGEASDPTEVVIDTDADPEPLYEDRIDIGEVIAEELALALDPYPRAPGQAFVEPPATGEERPDSPFAALAALKKGPKPPA